MRIKVISLWQPWASLMVTGAKKIETRSWATNYRGPLGIHAAKKWAPELESLLSFWHFQGGLAPMAGQPLDLSGKTWAGVKKEHLPFGAIIGICDLSDCIPTDELKHGQVGHDYHFGDFSLGRFGWMTDNMVSLKDPIYCTGRQGLWNYDLPDELLKRG